MAIFFQLELHLGEENRAFLLDGAHFLTKLRLKGLALVVNFLYCVVICSLNSRKFEIECSLHILLFIVKDLNEFKLHICDGFLLRCENFTSVSVNILAILPVVLEITLHFLFDTLTHLIHIFDVYLDFVFDAYTIQRIILKCHVMLLELPGVCILVFCYALKVLSQEIFMLLICFDLLLSLSVQKLVPHFYALLYIRSPLLEFSYLRLKYADGFLLCG